LAQNNLRATEEKLARYENYFWEDSSSYLYWNKTVYLAP
jgi:hypothetical protein